MIELNRQMSDFMANNHNLDDGRTGFVFSDPPYGGFIGSVDMLKWLVRNRSEDYWKMKSEQKASEK